MRTIIDALVIILCGIAAVTVVVMVGRFLWMVVHIRDNGDD